MRYLVLVLSASVPLLVCLGCNSQQVRFTTLQLSSTLPDLTERQVLDNLARTAVNPSGLPYLALVTDGTANVKDAGTFSAALAGDPRAYTKGTFTPGASREVTGNWSLKPTVNPQRLAAMLIAYNLALGLPVDPDDRASLGTLLGGPADTLVPTGWVCVGKRRDVPFKDAIYVAHCRDVYIWVMPEHSKQMTQFVLLMLHIYSTPNATPTVPIAGKTMPQPLPINPFSQPGAMEYPPDTNRGLFFIR